MSKSNILFLNHKQAQCGVYQYGKRSANILKKSTDFNFIYREIENDAEYWSSVNTYNPIGIIYNYHPLTMAWLGHHNIVKYPNTVHYGLHHEGSFPDHIKFNYYLMVDTTFIDENNKLSVLRPLVEGNINYVNPNIPTFGSFGFGFGNKGFGRVVKLINDQYDEAIIRLQIPRAYFGDRNGEASSQIFPGCQNEMRKPNIKLEITTDFLDDDGLLNFLAANTANIFLYDHMPERGLSSVIDYAVSVKKPMVISKSHMFRHILSTSPSICYEDRTLVEIINSGDEPLQQFRDKWSSTNFINRYKLIINNTRKR